MENVICPFNFLKLDSVLKSKKKVRMKKNQINKQLLNHHIILRNENDLCPQCFTVAVLGTLP
jgi:hypothetical protein